MSQSIGKLPSVLANALRLEQRGNRTQAQNLFASIVRREPFNRDAWRGLVRLSFTGGALEEVLSVADSALQCFKGDQELLMYRALALQGLSRQREALEVFVSLLHSAGPEAELLCRIGQCHQALGERSKAVEAFGAALELQPYHLLSLAGLCLAHQIADDIPNLRATATVLVDALDRSTSGGANSIQGDLEFRGNALRWAGRFEEALSSYCAAANRAPRSVSSLVNAGHACHDLNRHHEAALWYERALSIEPEVAAIWCHHGNALVDADHIDEAISSLRRAAELAPDSGPVHCYLGTALLASNRITEGLAELELAVNLDRNHTLSWSHRSVALYRLNRIPEAIESAYRCLALRPDHVDGHSNLATALLAENRLGDAQSHLVEALRLNPNHASARFTLAMCQLRGGDFSGWRNFESRWDLKVLGRQRRYAEHPLWMGSELKPEQTLLLHAEQGLGDTLQFCRYAPLVALGGARVVLQVQPALKQLLRSLPGIDLVIDDGEVPPAFDLQCPLMSLPLAMGTTVETIPSAPCYLAAEPDRVQYWADRLGPKSRGRIGLVWSGSTSHTQDFNRSIPLQQLLQALPPGFQYIALQKEVRDSDRHWLECNDIGLHFFGDELVDFSDTAALCTLMDLVISVDTSVVHLAGAIGTNAWLLLPFCPDYRWMLDRADSPWYPTITLLRQPVPGDWDSVLGLIQANLAAVV